MRPPHVSSRNLLKKTLVMLISRAGTLDRYWRQVAGCYDALAIDPLGCRRARVTVDICRYRVAASDERTAAIAAQPLGEVA